MASGSDAEAAAPPDADVDGSVATIQLDMPRRSMQVTFTCDKCGEHAADCCCSGPCRVAQQAAGGMAEIPLASSRGLGRFGAAHLAGWKMVLRSGVLTAS